MRLEITPVEGDPNHTTGGYMLYDLDAGAKIGDAAITCQPMLIDIAGEQHVLFAGTADTPEQRFSAVNGHRYPVLEGALDVVPRAVRTGHDGHRHGTRPRRQRTLSHRLAAAVREPPDVDVRTVLDHLRACRLTQNQRMRDLPASSPAVRL